MKLDHVVSSLVISSSSIHVFCCGVPLLLSISTLATSLGITSAELHYFNWFHRHEHAILIGSGMALLFTALIQLISAQINCRTDGHCTHPPCDDEKSYSRWIFGAAVLLYIGNLALTFLSH